VTTTVVDLYSPDTYVDGPPHEVFAELRRTQPVYWQDIPGQQGYWAVLKHADVETVAKDPLLFSSAAGGVVLDTLDEPRLEQMRGMLLAMDPPRHRDYRRPLVHRLTPRQVARLEDGVRRICRDIFAAAGERGTVDFVNDVCSHLPTMVVGELMGLPREDWERIHALAEQITHGQDPDYAGGGSAAEATQEMGAYAYGFAVRRRAEPARDDLTSVLLESASDVEFASLFIQLVTAGQDTTQTMLSSGLLALLEHPDQLAALRADRTLIPGALEEILRWANPLHYFRRTATTDTSLRGVEIRAGDKVAMYYTSANRDEDAFDDPQRFDIRRSPNRHLSFGLAEHFCIGVHLARLEGRVFLDELLATFGSIEVAGPPKRLRSNLNNALTSLPVTLTS
jgi:cytochrome P450